MVPPQIPQLGNASRASADHSAADQSDPKSESPQAALDADPRDPAGLPGGPNVERHTRRNSGVTTRVAKGVGRPTTQAIRLNEQSWPKIWIGQPGRAVRPVSTGRCGRVLGPCRNRSPARCRRRPPLLVFFGSLFGLGFLAGILLGIHLSLGGLRLRLRLVGRDGGRERLHLRSLMQGRELAGLLPQ